MLVNLSLSLLLAILHVGIFERNIFTGAVQYEDEFQRSNFYTNEQGVGVEVGKNLPPHERNTAVRLHEKGGDHTSLHRDPEISKNSQNSEGNSPNEARLHQYDHLDVDTMGEVKSMRQNGKAYTKRSFSYDRLGKPLHYRIPNNRVQYLEGLDAQDTVDSDKNLVVLSREETRGLRQVRKSFSDQANTNWKWGFKRKQFKPEHGSKDAGFSGGNHSPSCRHKEAMYSRNPQSDAMARCGHPVGEMLDNEGNVPRQNIAPVNPRMMEMKNVKDESSHPQMFSQRLDASEDHFHKGVAQQKMDSMVRVGAPEVYYQKGNVGQRLDSSSKINNGWVMENPRIYSAPKYENGRASRVTNNGFHVESLKPDNGLRVENPKVENGLRMDNQPMDLQGPNAPMETMRVDNGPPMEDTRNENVPRMEEPKNEEIYRMDQQRINDNSPRMVDPAVEPIPRVDARYNSNAGIGFLRSDSVQRNENSRCEGAHNFDNPRLEANERMESASRCDNAPVADNSWRDDSSPRVANAPKMKLTQTNYNSIPAVANPPKPYVPRMVGNPNYGSSAGAPVHTEEIRYLVFSPAEFSPMTLHRVLGEPEKPMSQQIPYCTLEEYQIESASLRGKSYDSPHDRKMQYRGKGYINELSTRLKRKIWERRKNTRSRQKRIKSSKCREENSPERPVHRCTATIGSTVQLPGLVIQTEPFNQISRLTETECYVDLLTSTTSTPDRGRKMWPSELFRKARERKSDVSHFKNARHRPVKHSAYCPTQGVNHKHISKVKNITLPSLSKCKRTADMALLTDILNNIVRSNTTSPAVNESRKKHPMDVEEEKIIEKYLNALMDMHSNRSKNTQEKVPYKGGLWLGQLLEELAQNKWKTKMRNLPVSEPFAREETAVRLSNE